MNPWWWGVASYLLFAAAAPAQHSNPHIHVGFDYPAQGAQYVAPADVSIHATATVIDDNVYVTSITLSGPGGQLRQVQGPQTIEYTLSGLGPGTYHLSVIARNNFNRSASDTRSFTVIAPGEKPPTIDLPPPTGAPFIGPARIGLSAAAADSDGHVVKVEYFANGQYLGETTTAPYAFSWNDVAPGSYQLTGRATDNNGKQTTSAAVAVVVEQSTVRGHIEGVYPGANNEYLVKGWACSSGRNAPIDVHLYVGGGWPQGTRIGMHTASLPSEVGIAAACQAQGAAYRFAIPLTPAQQQAHANQAIYIHGISPIGAEHRLLGNSGTFKVPAPLRLSRRYVYDQHEQLCKTLEPETGATVMDYDEAGNLLWSAAGLDLPDPTQCNRAEAYASGRRVDRGYDARNRLKTLNFPDGRGNQTWNYYPDGLTQSVVTDNDGPSQGTVVNAYAYNKRRLPTSESVSQPDWYTWSLGYGHDASGHLRTLTYPFGFTVNYDPNALGQPRGVWDVASGAALASGARYAPNGALQQFTYGNGIVHTMQQNARQLPARAADAGVSDLAYRYDANGNVTAIPDHLRGEHHARAMHYDGLDRLLAAGSPSFGGDHWHRFTYDALDNLKSWKLAGVKDHADYFYDPRNRLTNIRNSGGASVIGLGYDVQGNLQNKNGQFHDFDYGNRLRSVLGGDWYRYDGHGRRVLTWHPNGAGYTLWVYSQSGQMLYRESNGDTRKSEHVYLGGSLLAIRERNWTSGAIALKYQHTDALGSPVAVTGESGQVIARTDWEPFGAAIGQPAYDGVGYTGHVMDGATGLTYMQQRYYDPQAGRFLSVDPVTAHAKLGQNFNRYWYGNNNPYKFKDPDGRVAIVNRMKDGSIQVDIPATFKGPAATESNISAVKNQVQGLSGTYKVDGKDTQVNFRITSVTKDTPRSARNTITLTAGPTERRNGLSGAEQGGKRAWVDVTDRFVANGTAPHEILHLADNDDRYDRAARKSDAAKGNNIMNVVPGVMDSSNIQEIMESGNNIFRNEGG